MGKAKRHAKVNDKSRSTKSHGRDIKRRQHSQDTKLNKAAKAATPNNTLSKDVKRPQKLKVPFTAFDRVLLVGEGDFSFTLSLARHHRVGAIVATSYDDESALKTKYPSIDATLKSLAVPKQVESVDPSGEARTETEWSGFSSAPESDVEEAERRNLKCSDITILHGINATSVSKSHKKTINAHAPFTKIVFNFPHTGGLSTDVNRQVRANQELLVNFFNAAKPLLATKAHPARELVKEEYDSEDYDKYNGDRGENDRDVLAQQIPSAGQILVTLFEGEPYTLWNIRDLARHCGLQVIESFKFPWSAYPGYKHARTIGDIVTGKDRSDEGKRKGAWRGEEREARCYVLGLKAEMANAGGRKRKRSNDDSDEDK